MPSHAEEWGRNKDCHPIRPERRLQIMLRAADGECEVGRLLAFALVMGRGTVLGTHTPGIG
jgi:hypothetical protein